MIAPYQKTKDPSSSTMRRVRRMVASTLLQEESESRGPGSRVAGWKGWLFAAWVVVPTAVYFVFMFGWF